MPFLYQLRVAAGAPDVSSDRAAKFPARSDTKRRSVSRIEVFSRMVGVMGYAAPGAGFVPAAVPRYLPVLLSCCPVVVADVSVISCCGFYRVSGAKPSRRIKLALLSSGGASELPALFPVLLWVILLLWFFFGCIGGHTGDRYAAGNRSGSSAGCVLFPFLPAGQDIAIKPSYHPICRKISVTATMARKAVALPAFALFSLLTAGCTGLSLRRPAH